MNNTLILLYFKLFMLFHFGQKLSKKNFFPVINDDWSLDGKVRDLLVDIFKQQGLCIYKLINHNQMAWASILKFYFRRSSCLFLGMDL